jgi:hypothetical protein
MIAIIIGAAIAFFLAILKFPKMRHAFLVPEGYAGLLYHKGKFVEVLGARVGTKVLPESGRPANQTRASYSASISLIF